MKKMIEGYVTSGQFRTIHYVFSDALEIDPTFEKYEEAYEYCKTVPGVMDAHEEMTPFRNDPATWDEKYWLKLKMDLVKNFSDVRMSHMREVAKVILAEKIQRLQAERAAAASKKIPNHELKTPMQSVVKRRVSTQNRVMEEEQARRLEQRRKEIEEYNKKLEEQEAASRITSTEGDASKKAIGIALAAGVGAAILITVLVLALR